MDGSKVQAVRCVCTAADCPALACTGRTPTAAATAASAAAAAAAAVARTAAVAAAHEEDVLQVAVLHRLDHVARHAQHRVARKAGGHKACLALGRLVRKARQLLRG